MEPAQEAVAHDPRVIEKSLHEILSQRQFSGLFPLNEGDDHSRAFLDFFDRLLGSSWMKAITTFIGKLISPLLHFMEKMIEWTGSDAFGFFLVFLCLFLMILMVVQIIKTVKKSVINQVENEKSDRSPARTESELKRLENSAREAESASDYLKAMQELYRALLIAMDERKVLTLNPSLTNFEIEAILTTVRDREIVGLFHSLNALFEDKYYAGRGVTKDDFVLFNSHYQVMKGKL